MPKSDQKKAAALAALMECDTFTEAAQKADISRKTLYNYLTEDQEFASAYRAMQERRTLERADQAEANYNAAVQTVLELMEYGKAPPCREAEGGAFPDGLHSRSARKDKRACAEEQRAHKPNEHLCRHF